MEDCADAEVDNARRANDITKSEIHRRDGATDPNQEQPDGVQILNQIASNILGDTLALAYTSDDRAGSESMMLRSKAADLVRTGANDGPRPSKAMQDSPELVFANGDNAKIDVAFEIGKEDLAIGGHADFP